MLTHPVPNGGYAASCMLAAAGEHLSPRDQPDTLTAHFEYPSRTATGPAIVVIEDVKLGTKQSTLHLTLWQGGLIQQAPWITPSVSRRAILAYATLMNLRTFEGISMPTGYEVTPAAELPPIPDLEALKTKGRDDSWKESIAPQSSAIVRSLRNWHFYIPRGDPPTPGVLHMWTRLATGEHITQSTLPYVVDSFPYDLHTFLATPELRKILLQPPGPEDSVKKTKTDDGGEDDAPRASLWFPTVVMNMEAKTVLPEEGVEWLAVRVTTKQIKEGKFDIDVLVRDLDGELVALSHHVAMILSIERNTAKRRSAKASL